MFSQMGPLFKTALRQAERTDARLEIRRDEKDNPAKKHDRQEDEADTNAFWEDTTAVSVEALRAFLIGFLKEQGEKLNESERLNIITPPEPQAPPHSLNPAAARAAQAYSTTASHAAPPPPEPPQTNNDDSDQSLAELLKADELRTIHVLIYELDTLSRKGVQMLTLEKADTFLESLVQAVDRQKAIL